MVANLNNPVHPGAITALTANTGGYPEKDTAEEVIEHLEGNDASLFLVPGGKWGFDGNLLTPTSALVPPAFHLILSAAVDIPLQTAVALNKNAARPFQDSFSFQGLYGLELPAHMSQFMAIEFMNCYHQALWNLVVYDMVPASDPEDLHWKSFLPWEDPMKSMIGGSGGYPMLWTDSENKAFKDQIATRWSAHIVNDNVTCWSVHEILRAYLRLFLEKPADCGGVTCQFYEVVYTGTRLTLEEQINFLFYRALERDAPPAVESETLRNLAKAGLAVGAASVAVNAAENVVKGGFWGGFTGLAASLLSAAKPLLDQVIQFIRPALVVLFFMPHITGMISAVTIGFFPIVITWSLFPGQHFKPLINYFMVLLFSQSAPIWYAIGDALSGFAYRSVGGGGDAGCRRQGHQCRAWPCRGGVRRRGGGLRGADDPGDPHVRCLAGDRRRDQGRVMMNRILCGVMVLLMIAGPAQADLFDRVIKDMYMDDTRRRSSYSGRQTMVGGAVTRYPISISNPQVDHFRINTPCGSWSLTPQGVLNNLTEMLDPDRLKAALMAAIQSSIQNLVGAVVSKLSMLTVCYAVPTLCDLTKHMQAISGQLHNVRALSCQQLEGMVNNVANSLTAGRTSRCIQAQIGAGMSLNVAQRMCASGEWDAAPTHPGPLQGWGIFGDNASASTKGHAFPDDPMVVTNAASFGYPDLDETGSAGSGERREQKLIRDTLETALADSTMSEREKYELLDFQKHMIGDVTVRDPSADPANPNTPPGDDEPAETEYDPEMPEYKLHDYYRSEFSRFDGVLECAINTFGGHTDLLTDPTLDAACGSIQYALITDTGGATSGSMAVSTPAQALQELSVPGFEIPIQALRGLRDLREVGDVDTYEAMKGKVSGTLALMRSLWKTRELRDELETGMMGKDDQTEEERMQTEVRLRRLEREAARMVESRDVAERFMIPTVQAIVQQREMRRARELERILRAPGLGDRKGIMGGMPIPFGYKLQPTPVPP